MIDCLGDGGVTQNKEMINETTKDCCDFGHSDHAVCRERLGHEFLGGWFAEYESCASCGFGSGFAELLVIGIFPPRIRAVAV